MNSADQVEAHLRALTERHDPEELCTRCGDCCVFAFRMPTPVGMRRYLVPDLPCRHLVPTDGGRRICAVYDRRAEAAPWCGDSLAGQLTRGVASARCGYMTGQDWFVPSEPIPADMLADLASSILEHVARVEHTLDPDALARFRARWSPSD